jgi:hypothetical protein
MINELFIIVLTVLCTLYLRWGFRVLPLEGWQILASLPVRKIGPDTWDGINLTYYGLLSATAYLVSIASMIILMGSLGVPDVHIAFLAMTILAICLPASPIIARLVEKKPFTLTVGGASFVGILLAPWIIWGAYTILKYKDAKFLVMPSLTAMVIAYTFGEGLGRLACISFGCCYGKSLDDCSPFLQNLFKNHCFVFTGKTKKIAYASGLDGKKVLPVQALTASLFLFTALFCTYLFLKACHTAAFLIGVIITQGWRVFSETLRADYRGEGKLSTYQIMALVSIVTAIFLTYFFPAPDVFPDLRAGLALLWNPGMIFFLIFWWIGTFLYTGLSRVTGSRVTFHVHTQRI